MPQRSAKNSSGSISNDAAFLPPPHLFALHYFCSSSPLTRHTTDAGYLPVDLIQVALCPLKFEPQTLRDHIIYKGQHASIATIKKDKALEHLQVGESIDQWRAFKYWTKSKNRATGSINIKAPYGMSAYDFDILVGIYNYLRDRHRSGELSENVMLEMRLSQLARICRVGSDGGKQADRLRSSLFRLNFFSLHSTAEWTQEAGDFGHRTIKLFTVKYLNRLGKTQQGTKNSDKIVLHIDQSFMDLVKSNRVVQFDRSFYGTLSPKHKRHYLQAVRFGWWDKNSPPDLDAEQYAINQIWMTDKDTRLRRDGTEVPARDRRNAHRIDWMKRLCREAQGLGYIQTTKKGGWGGEYLKLDSSKTNNPCYFVRWKIGKRITNKGDLDSKTTLKSDELWIRTQSLRDDSGNSPTPRTYKQWIKKYSRQNVAKQLEVVQWMADNKKQFTKSAVQTLVDRLENDYTPPDEFRSQPQLAMFSQATLTRDTRLQQDYQTVIKEI